MPRSFSNQLREAIKHSGMSHYRISKKSGVSASNLCRFTHGAEIRSGSIDRLCKVLKIELAQTKRNGRGRGIHAVEKDQERLKDN